MKAKFIKEMHDNTINVAVCMLRVNLNMFELQLIKLKTDYVPNMDSSRLVDVIFVKRQTSEGISTRIIRYPGQNTSGNVSTIREQQ